MDRSAFASPDFDVRAWINDVCASSGDASNLDRFLAELEVKVQLAAEDVQQSLYNSSSNLINKVALASTELVRTREEVLALSDSVGSLASQVAADERSCSAAASRLRQLDAVKLRVLDAKSTIEEASAMKQQYEQLSTVLDTNDMPQMQDVLRSMKRSLATLAQVPEFAGVADKVAVLESRVKEIAVPRLAAAIRDQNGDALRYNWEALQLVQKADLAQEVYVRHICDSLQDVYTQVAEAQTPVDEWLPRWQQGMLRVIAVEKDWLTLQLPDQQPALFLQALSVALKTFVRPVQQQLAALQGSAEVTLRALTSSLKTTTSCCTQLAAQFPDLEPRVLASLTHPLLQPYESFIGDYVRLEAVVLSQELKSIKVGAPPPLSCASAADRTSSVVETLASAPDKMQAAALAALQRCADFTANAELLQLLPELDTSLQRTLEGFRASIRALAVTLSSRSPPRDPSAFDEVHHATPSLPPLPQDAVRSLLQLLPAADALQRAIAAIDTEVRSHGTCVLALAQCVHRGERPGAIGVSQRAADLMSWRLGTTAELERALTWQGKVDGMLLPNAFAALSALAEEVDQLVLAALCAPCHAALQQMRDMGNTWAEDGTLTQLTSFAAFPSQCSTAICEHLMAVPPLMEVLVDEASDSDAEHALAARWLERVASDVARELCATVLAIPTLGGKGSLQLAADLEYICNSITALGAELSIALATVCTLSTVVLESDFKGTIAAGLSTGTIDRHASKVMAKMRGIELN